MITSRARRLAYRLRLTSFSSSLCVVGMALGVLLVAASLMPTLVPRSPLVQGLLSGVCLSAGYGLGVMLRGLWRALGLREARGRLRRWSIGAVLLVCATTMALALVWMATWQNRLRALMHMSPVEGTGVLLVLVLTLMVFVILLVLARLFGWLWMTLTQHVQRRLPTHVAGLIGLIVSVAIFWSLGNGVLVSSALRALDSSYAELDARLEEDRSRPTSGLKTGGPGSLLDWHGLGMQGRRMIADGPTLAQIESVTGREAQEPLRVYVGLRSAPTARERARLALAELRRIGAFERAHLVIATPTGTGWVDEESQHALEYLLHGDVATVAVQYSYFASWHVMLADPDYGVETARAVFAEVHEYWRRLPSSHRPRLYLHGLSLGAINSSLSHDLHQVISDPYHGALWAGPPFNTPAWRNATAMRNHGSPAWLPRVGDGSVMRFLSQDAPGDDGYRPWGRHRVVFLQYASDAVTFYDPKALWRKPEWMYAPLGPDVSPDMVWIPVVSFLQLSFDLMVAVSPPKGFGHVYAFEHYVDAWAELTGPSEWWTPERLARLKRRGSQP